MRLFALVPFYKPGTAFPDVVRELAALDAFDAVVAVNDGSGDAYDAAVAEIERSGQATVLRHPENRGKGAALKTGFAYLLDTYGDDIGVVTVDADGQHAADDVAAVADALRAAPQELVLGVRGFDRDVPLRSAFGNAMTRRALKLFHGVDLADTQTGLRGFNGALARRFARIPADRYDFEIEMLLDARAAGVAFRQQPIQTIYLDNNATSHFRVIVDSSRIYFAILRFSLASLIAAVIDNIVFAIVFSMSGSIVWAQTAARAVALVVNYVMVRDLVFHSKDRHIVTLPKYLLTVAALAVVSYTMIVFASDAFGVNPIAAKIGSEILIFGCSFLVQRYLVFPERRESR